MKDQRRDDNQDLRQDALLPRLRSLPRPQPSLEASARSLRRARLMYLSSAPARHPGWAANMTIHLMRLYAHAEPALAATVVLAYLGWALETVRTIVR